MPAVFVSLAGAVESGDAMTVTHEARVRTKAPIVVGCCQHLIGEHHDDGCEHGWTWNGYGVATVEGCKCPMRGPA